MKLYTLHMECAYIIVSTDLKTALFHQGNSELHGVNSHCVEDLRVPTLLLYSSLFSSESFCF